MASGATLSTAVNLQALYEKVYLEVPTMASGSLYIQGSSDGSIYRRITQEATPASDFEINSAATQRMIAIPPYFQHYKVESSSGATDTTTTFKFICMNPKN